MKKILFTLAALLSCSALTFAQQPAAPPAAARPRPSAADTTPRPKVVVFYAIGVEYDHLLFEQEAIRFLNSNANKDHYNLVVTTDWDQLNADLPQGRQGRRLAQRRAPHAGRSATPSRRTWSTAAAGSASTSPPSTAQRPQRLVPQLPRRRQLRHEQLAPAPRQGRSSTIPTSPVTKGLPAAFEAPQNSGTPGAPDPASTPTSTS